MLTTAFVMVVSLVICWALLGVLNIFRIDKSLPNPVDHLSLLEGEDKIWADNMLLKAGIGEEPKPKQLVLDDGLRIDHQTNSIIVSKEWADKYTRESLVRQAHREAADFINKQRNVKIDEFRAKVEARSMVAIYERSHADKPLIKSKASVRYDHETQTYQLDTGQRITKDVFEDLAIRARMELQDIYEIYTGESHIPIKYYGIPAEVFR